MYGRMRNIITAFTRAVKKAGIGHKRLAAIMAGIVLFGIFNVMYSFVPLMILLIVGFAFGIRIDAPKIFGLCGILCSLLAGIVFAPAFGGSLLLAMSVIPVVRYREKRFIAFAVLAFDIFTGTLVSAVMGWFLLFAEILVLMAVNYRQIIDFMLDYIEFGTLGPIDDFKKKHNF